MQAANARANSERVSFRGAIALGRSADEWLLEAIRSTPEGMGAGLPMNAASRAGEHGVLWVFLGCAIAVVDRRRWRLWLFAGLSAPVSILINFVLKQIVRRPRPALRSDEPQSSSSRRSFSFPSAHATSSFAAATIAGKVERRVWAPSIGLASLVSYSRIYRAKHYPADVVAGAIFGSALGAMAASKLSDSGATIEP